MATRDSLPSELGVEDVLAALRFTPGEQDSAVPYTVIRGNHGPRWLLPHDNRMVYAILREWRPYGLATHIFWRGLRTAARLGVLPLMPGTTQTRMPRASATHLLRCFGFEGDAGPPVILVGNTQATRKLLVFLEAAECGKVVIKIPLTPRARASLGNETEMLKRLNGEHGAPRLLGYHLDTGAAMQQYLSGRMGSRRLQPDYLRLLIGLARRGETVTLRARAAELRERLDKHGAEIPKAWRQPASSRGASGDWQTPIERALRLLDDDTELPATLVHGDFAPWNIRDLRDGRCALIDWESAQWTALPMHDLCHFFCMQSQLFAPQALFSDALERDGAWRRYGDALGIDWRLFRPLMAAFLLESLARALEWNVEEPAAYYLGQLKRFLQKDR